MIRRAIPVWLFALLSVIFLMALAGLYMGLSWRQTAKNPQQRVIPGLKAIGEGWQKALKPQGTESNPRPAMLWTDLRATYWRLMQGMSIGILASVVVGVLMGAYRWIEACLSPIIAFMSKVPQIAILPIFFAVVGTDEKMFLSMIAFGIFFTLTESIYQAVRKDVTDDAIDKAYTLGASDPEIIYEVVWKQILPRILDAVRLHIGPAMGFLLAAEMLVGGQGMGYRIRMESRVTDMRIVYTYVAILGTTGLLADWLLIMCRRRLCPWFGQ